MYYIFSPKAIAFTKFFVQNLTQFKNGNVVEHTMRGTMWVTKTSWTCGGTYHGRNNVGYKNFIENVCEFERYKVDK